MLTFSGIVRDPILIRSIWSSPFDDQDAWKAERGFFSFGVAVEGSPTVWRIPNRHYPKTEVRKHARKLTMSSSFRQRFTGDIPDGNGPHRGWPPGGGVFGV